MRYLVCLLGALFIVFSVSCRTSTPNRTGENPDGTGLLSDVPFFSQDDFQCGPAALATIVNYWYGRLGLGDPVTPESIAKEIYSPTAKGVLGIDLEIYAKRHGFLANQYQGSVLDLRKLIDQKIPPIILVDFGISLFQINHFVVVTGYTPEGVLANTGRRENGLITERRLDSIWKKTGYWTLVIKPLR
jgi:predicted double-glycine peptidase